jgi:hypothetical protein
MGSGSSVLLNELSRLSNDAVYGPKIRDVFDMLDTDGSGSLDYREIQTYMCVWACCRRWVVASRRFALRLVVIHCEAVMLRTVSQVPDCRGRRASGRRREGSTKHAAGYAAVRGVGPQRRRQDHVRRVLRGH